MASAGFNTPIGLPFTELTEVDSTNIYAMNQVKTNLAGHGAAFLAQHQWAGKGQMGKVWEAKSTVRCIEIRIIENAMKRIGKFF